MSHSAVISPPAAVAAEAHRGHLQSSHHQDLALLPRGYTKRLAFAVGTAGAVAADAVKLKPSPHAMAFRLADLPPEIRHLIWDATLPERRVFHVSDCAKIAYPNPEEKGDEDEEAEAEAEAEEEQHEDGIDSSGMATWQPEPGERTFDFYIRHAPPLATQICRESRMVALSSGFFFLSPSSRPSRGCTSPAWTGFFTSASSGGVVPRHSSPARGPGHVPALAGGAGAAAAVLPARRDGQLRAPAGASRRRRHVWKGALRRGAVPLRPGATAGRHPSAVGEAAAAGAGSRPRDARAGAVADGGTSTLTEWRTIRREMEAALDSLGRRDKGAAAEMSHEWGRALLATQGRRHGRRAPSSTSVRGWWLLRPGAPTNYEQQQVREFLS
ncbi:hypothetical protein ACCO45_000161 [Purpureocillium lilacinum]|uniref:Uncharacterized protein n=1 Tax=Purpureocillium lilacinum TaxID=33203 RepID=A0ACC4E3G0_PURLI